MSEVYQSFSIAPAVQGVRKQHNVPVTVETGVNTHHTSICAFSARNSSVSVKARLKQLKCTCLRRFISFFCIRVIKLPLELVHVNLHNM